MMSRMPPKKTLWTKLKHELTSKALESIQIFVDTKSLLDLTFPVGPTANLTISETTPQAKSYRMPIMASFRQPNNNFNMECPFAWTSHVRAKMSGDLIPHNRWAKAAMALLSYVEEGWVEDNIPESKRLLIVDDDT
jgi:hypothetical protein